MRSSLQGLEAHVVPVLLHPRTCSLKMPQKRFEILFLEIGFADMYDMVGLGKMKKSKKVVEKIK